MCNFAYHINVLILPRFCPFFVTKSGVFSGWFWGAFLGGCGDRFGVVFWGGFWVVGWWRLGGRCSGWCSWCREVVAVIMSGGGAAHRVGVGCFWVGCRLIGWRPVGDWSVVGGSDGLAGGQHLRQVFGRWWRWVVIWKGCSTSTGWLRFSEWVAVIGRGCSSSGRRWRESAGGGRLALAARRWSAWGVVGVQPFGGRGGLLWGCSGSPRSPGRGRGIRRAAARLGWGWDAAVWRTGRQPT